VIDLDEATFCIGHHHRHMAVLEDLPESLDLATTSEYSLDGRRDVQADLGPSAGFSHAPFSWVI
jgi:hypothetical protein